MNLRRHWNPGYPGLIKPNTTGYDDLKEEFVMQESFVDPFPQELMRDGVPDLIGTPAAHNSP